MPIEATRPVVLPRAAELDLPIDRTATSFVVFAHAFPDADASGAARLISRAFTRQGAAVVRLKVDDAGGDGDAGMAVEAVLESARYLEERFGPPSLLVGHSGGAAAVLAATGRLSSVRAVATIGAPFADEENPLASGPGGKRALLIMHSPTDAVVPIENAARLFLAARHPKSFISLEGADHVLSKPEDVSYVCSILEGWARRYVDMRRLRDPDLDPHDHRVMVRIGRDRFRTEIRAAGHALVADEPVVLGGTDQGATPYDLFVGGLGACVAITIRMYADRKEWPLEGVEVRLTHRKVPVDLTDCEGESTRKLDMIEREITLLGDLDDAQRARLLEIADRCPVHRTLESSPCVRTIERRVGTEGA